MPFSSRLLHFFFQNFTGLALGRAGQTLPDAARISLEQGTGSGEGSETPGRPAKRRALWTGSKCARHEVFLTNYGFLAVHCRERCISSSSRTSLASTPASGPAAPIRPGGCKGQNPEPGFIAFHLAGFGEREPSFGCCVTHPARRAKSAIPPADSSCRPSRQPNSRDAVPVIAPASNLASRRIGHCPPPNYDSVPFPLPLRGRAEERRRAELRDLWIVSGTDFRMGPAALQVLSDR